MATANQLLQSCLTNTRLDSTHTVFIIKSIVKSSTCQGTQKQIIFLDAALGFKGPVLTGYCSPSLFCRHASGTSRSRIITCSWFGYSLCIKNNVHSIACHNFITFIVRKISHKCPPARLHSALKLLFRCKPGRVYETALFFARK